jgi:hypothetical protein
MLLVMSTQGVFHPISAVRNQQPTTYVEIHNLWDITWKRLDVDLPGLKDELFPGGFTTSASADKESSS